MNAFSDNIKKAKDYLMDSSVVAALGQAAEEIRNNPAVTFSKKIGLFFKEFVKGLLGIEREEAQVSDQAAKASLDKMTEVIQRQIVFDPSVPAPEQAEMKTITSGVLDFYARYFDNNEKQAFDTAFEKMRKAAKGETTDPLTPFEMRATAAFGVSLIVQVKKVSKDANEFAQTMEYLAKSTLKSDQVEYKLGDIFKVGAFGAFNIKLDKMGYLEKAGLMGTAASYLADFGLSLPEGMQLAELNDAQMVHRNEIIATFTKLLPQTAATPNKIAQVVDAINGIMKPGGTVSTLAFANVLYMVADSDLTRICGLLLGISLTP